ncbi:hypothetical protein BTM25_29300 [Actinomadura rubteroloni]|uniref:Rv2525c-like glycoside hydrolase-like domain-containing protein n=1 Tax=Actinomadura rubteroloni TaxID=1926885 RepID=A0A2P4UGZ0_9ACTN|nr:DUF1906 domain-containing protein [Actinomadura rubteroloni]POM24301.1 hypothetical protein BTM25_29300 [Actinomadura rubteroloni]
MRNAVVLGATCSVAAVLVVGLRPSAAGTPGGPSAALNHAARTTVVAYRGVRVPVPAGWTVHRLDREPTRCVRYDVDAVYVGRPGSSAEPDCPARVIGGAAALHVEPLDTAGLRRRGPVRPDRLARYAVRATPEHLTRVALPEAGVTLSGVYGTDPAPLQDAIRRTRLTPSWSPDPPTAQPAGEPAPAARETSAAQPAAQPGEPPAAPSTTPRATSAAKPVTQAAATPAAAPSGKSAATPRKPVAQPGTAPGRPAATPPPKPRARPAAAPGGESAATPPKKRGAASGGKPAPTPSRKPAARPGDVPGGKPVARPGAASAGRPGAASGGKSSATSAGKTAARPGTGSAGRPGAAAGGRPVAGTSVARPGGKPRAGGGGTSAGEPVVRGGGAGKVVGEPVRAVQESARPHWVRGRAFDTCAAPSLATMRAWRTAYRIANIYIGGVSRGCAQPHLTRAWVRRVRALGYRLIPTYVGPQAPCTRYRARFTRGDARAEGAGAAADAVRRARALGIPAGSPIYADLEDYDSGDASCRTAVLDFVETWTRTLRAHHYVAGLYSSAASGIRDIGRAPRTRAKPPVVWFGHWDGRPSVYDSRYLNRAWWPPHRRIKQYRGSHRERHGGVALRVDANAVDGRVY